MKYKLKKLLKLEILKNAFKKLNKTKKNSHKKIFTRF